MASFLRVIHWNKQEGEGLAAFLSGAGYSVRSRPFEGMEDLRALGEDPPSAVVIDLRRAPSMGREAGMALRARRSTRALPLVFIEGDPPATERVRALLPDAVFTPASRSRSAVKRAIANPPAQPVAPASSFAAYAGTPLLKKLGIKPGMKVGLVGAPAGFEHLIGRLPAGTTLTCRALRPDLTLWFVRRAGEMQQRIEKMVPRGRKGGLWIIWPKKGGGIESDLTQAVVRKTGLDAGLVDFKIAALDAVWSGLRFSLREK